MKKFTVLVVLALSLILLLSVIAPELGIALADEAPQELILDALNLDTADSAAYAFMAYFLEEHADRTPGTAEEAAAATTLAEILTEMGYADKASDCVKPFKFTNPLDGEIADSNNVVAVKPAASASELTVILGAHYDNRYALGGSGLNAEGAVDNGSGVGTLLAASYALKDVSLPFELVIAFFGAEQLGYFGSRNYADNLKNPENVLLYVDFNMVAGGDYLYLYCDEVDTLHQDLIYKTAQSLGAELRLPPKNRQIYSVASDRLPYGHVGLNSDVSTFLDYGINSAHFFSYNWELKNSLYGRESAERNNVVGTSSDTLERFNKNLDQNKAKMNAAVQITVSALQKSDFVEVMQRSRTEKYDYSVLTGRNNLIIITAAVLAAVIGIMTAVYFVIKKKSGPAVAA
ncbi:MAG TPA: M28 family peptidase, partial [Clostridia bacterium]|nr:M28 family peptidase [Clostridia bacterium]